MISEIFFVIEMYNIIDNHCTCQPSAGRLDGERVDLWHQGI